MEIGRGWGIRGRGQGLWRWLSVTLSALSQIRMHLVPVKEPSVAAGGFPRPPSLAAGCSSIWKLSRRSTASLGVRRDRVPGNNNANGLFCSFTVRY